jgi:hypothetical protein
MNGVRVALSNYLKQKRPQPSLVVGEPDATNKEMEELGFTKQGDFWVISRKDAAVALDKILGIPAPFDWDKHWEIEEKTKRDAIPKPA